MWIPTLPTDDAPLYERLTRALADDIAAGALGPGDRLPPHRELAWRLGIGVGAVTRAYAEAQRRGLVEGHVGRGSFVAAHRGARAGSDAQAVVDLSRSLPPSAPAQQQIAQAMSRLSRRPDLLERLGYPDPGGFPADQQAGAAWIRAISDWEALSPDDLICCAGAQQGVAAAFGAACRPGAVVVAEAATFAGFKALAAHMDYRLVAAAMDEEGLTPEGLERAAVDSGARVAHVLPVQNPTARVMSRRRRAEIAEVARRRDLVLVEDDLYGAYAGGAGWDRLPPLAALAPERVFYVSALSKSLAPGLRIGWLVPPVGGAWRERSLSTLHAIALGAPALGAAIAAQWIEDGTALTLLETNRAELAVRTALALEILGAAVERPTLAATTHLWLPMSELEAERVAGRAGRAGVEVTPPDGPLLDRRLECGLRLCLGAADSRAALERGLGIVKAAIGSSGAETRTVI